MNIYLYEEKYSVNLYRELYAFTASYYIVFPTSIPIQRLYRECDQHPTIKKIH